MLLEHPKSARTWTYDFVERFLERHHLWVFFGDLCRQNLHALDVKALMQKGCRFVRDPSGPHVRVRLDKSCRREHRERFPHAVIEGKVRSSAAQVWTHCMVNNIVTGQFEDWYYTRAEPLIGDSSFYSIFERDVLSKLKL